MNSKGLLLVHTGHGKGKTTAAVGIVLRMLAHGRSVAVVQFIKASQNPAEFRLLEKHPNFLCLRTLGAGGSWRSRDAERDRSLAREAWDEAKKLLTNPDCQLLLLDEINIALRRGFIELDEVLRALDSRAENMHVLLSGRDAPPELCNAADLVTEFHLVKHPYQQNGTPAQAGIEF